MVIDAFSFISVCLFPMNAKRLRDVDYPRIMFHAPERTFDRLFKGAASSFVIQLVYPCTYTSYQKVPCTTSSRPS